MARLSFSIYEYYFSVFDKDLETYATGPPSYINTAPIPYSEASHCSL